MSTPQQPADDSIDRLYTEHHSWLYRWLSRRLDCAFEAEDLTQDTFLRVFTQPRKLDNIPKARSYLRLVADRLCIDLWRKRSVEQAWLEVLAEQPEAFAISPEHQAIIVETFCEIDEMLQRLPERVATAFVLSQIEGLTYREIAVRLEVSERSVKSYMAKAMLECMRIEIRYDEAQW